MARLSENYLVERFWMYTDHDEWKRCYEWAGDYYLPKRDADYTVTRHSVSLDDLDGRKIFYVAVLKLKGSERCTDENTSAPTQNVGFAS